MNREDRERFDALLEEVIGTLPEAVRALLDAVPVVVEDVPSREVLRELGMDEAEATELCGLHTGTASTERSVEGWGQLPSEIQLYREGIVLEAGGWDGEYVEIDDAGGGVGTAEEPRGDQQDDGCAAMTPLERVREEIRVTLLHEIGHEFGLDEDDLDELGYQ